MNIIESAGSTACSSPNNQTVQKIIKNDTVRYRRKGNLATVSSSHSEIRIWTDSLDSDHSFIFQRRSCCPQGSVSQIDKRREW